MITYSYNVYESPFYQIDQRRLTKKEKQKFITH
jgi:hypothetical protein